MKSLNNISLILIWILALVGCNDALDKTSSSSDAKASEQPNASAPSSSSSVIEIKSIAPKEKKQFLDESSFKEMTNSAQYNVLYFKFNKDVVVSDKNLKYWVAINSCEKIALINNEFEWPKIVKEYSANYGEILDKIPSDLNVRFSGYLGQYDVETKSFPVLDSVTEKDAFSINKVNLGGVAGDVCNSYMPLDGVNSYLLDLSQEVVVPNVVMNEDAAKEFVAKHSDPYSRNVIISMDVSVYGAVKQPQRMQVTFNAVPKKIKILDGKNKDILIHEFDFQLVN